MTNFKEILIVLNPVSFKGKAKETFKKKIEPLLKKKNLKYHVVETLEKGSHKLIIDTLVKLNTIDLMVSCGGDGTNFLVINALMDASLNYKVTQPALCTIPLGTGNDFNRSIGNYKGNKCNYEELIEMIAQGHTVEVDVGEAETTFPTKQSQVDLATLASFEASKETQSKKRRCFFINECSFGISADIMKTINMQSSFWVSKEFTFSFQSIAKQFTYKNKMISNKYDNESNFNKPFMSQLVACGNGQFFGAGFWINPKAKLNDGKFSICNLGDCSVFEALSIVSKLYKGAHGFHSKVWFEEATSIDLKTNNPKDEIYIEIDGELFGQMPATLSMRHKALSLVVDPKKFNEQQCAGDNVKEATITKRQ